MPHVEQDLLTLPEHLRSPLVFGGVRVVYSLVFYVVSCVLLFFCLSFSFLAMALSVCFRFMSLTVPLVSFVPLLLPLGRCLCWWTFCPRGHHPPSSKTTIA